MIAQIKDWIIAIALVVIAVALVGGNQSATPTTDLGASGSRFPNGISADSTSPSAGQVRGTTFTATGAATFGGYSSIISTVSSTLNIGGSGTKTGCIILGSATGNGVMYLTAVTTTGAGTVTVTSTKPAICY